MTTPAPDSGANCVTGVEGLDEVLGGGLPRNRLYLVQGDPGVGKTTLALNFLLEGIRVGEVGMYITLSETKEEMEAVARSHGWSLDKLHLFELSAKEAYLKGETENTFFHPSEVELNRTTQAVVDEVERVNPARIVFDSLSELRMLADTPLRYRRQILQLKQYFAGRNCTVLLLDDRTAGISDLQVESIAHGVLLLKRTAPEYGASRRQLQIQKIRGRDFRDGFHDIALRKGGVVVFPRLVAADHHSNFKGAAFSSGIAEFDALLGGGLDRGTSNMFMGPPGTGKSTLAMKFASVAANHGEKALFFLFDESTRTLLDRARNLDMDIDKHVRSGAIQLQHIDPAEVSPGELAHLIRKAVLTGGVTMVVIDSINGYLNAMPEERHLTLQLHELFAFLNQQGILTLAILAQQGLVGMMQSTVDLTYLADTVVLLRYFEARGAVKQAVSVIKKRSGNHERTIREITVDRKGIRVGPPLANMQGVLTGVPMIDSASVTPPSDRASS